MAKTLTFAVVHMGVAFTVVYLMTGSLAVGGAAALVEPAVNMVAYFFHEKAWNAYGRLRGRGARASAPAASQPALQAG